MVTGSSNGTYGVTEEDSFGRDKERVWSLWYFGKRTLIALTSGRSRSS